MDSDVVLAVLKVITEFRQSPVFDFLYRDVFGSYLPIGVFVVDGLREDVRRIAAVSVLNGKDFVVLRHWRFINSGGFGGVDDFFCVGGHHGADLETVFDHGSLAKKFCQSANDQYSRQNDSKDLFPKLGFDSVFVLILQHFIAPFRWTFA